MSQTKRLIASACLITFVGCAGNSQIPTSTTMADGGNQRYHAVKISFSAWEDTVMVDAGLSMVKGTDGKDACRFLQPLANLADGSTRWRPMQVYWALVAEKSDQIGEYKNVFFPGDAMGPKQLGLGTIAVRPLTDMNAKFVSFKNITLSPDAANLTFSFSVFRLSGENAVLVKSAVEGGKCVAATYKCDADSCDANTLDGYTPFTTVHITQGALGIPRDIEFSE